MLDKISNGSISFLPHSCFGCGNSVHPSCRVYSADLVRHFVRHGWTCDDCKTCIVCGEAQKNEDLIICEYCDLGVHYSCLDPRPEKRPKVRHLNKVVLDWWLNGKTIQK